MTSFPYEIIDLTHSLSATTPTWDGSCGFEHHLHHDYDLAALYQFKTHTISMKEGIGTHMDAPAHCISGASTIDELLLSNLVAPCALLDVSAVADENYSVSVQDLENFEHQYGRIASGSFIMIRTGWERFWNDPERYRNNYFFPSLSSKATAFLLTRDIVGIGIDTLSPDRGVEGFPAHKLLLSAGKYIVENAANLAQLPPQGGFVMILPLKIKGGTEAPVRMIGLVPK